MDFDSLSDVEALDLNRGFKEFESKVKNLDGIFKKMEDILFLSKYEQRKNEIIERASRDKGLDSEMTSSSMQLEYESMVLAPYIKELDDLTKEVEKELMPYYELHLLTTKINFELEYLTEENLVEVLESARKVLDLINKVNTHNDEDKNALVVKGYEMIYQVILQEKLFDRDDTLSYLNEKNVSSNKEYIGRLLSKDIDSLDEKTRIDEELKGIKKGLGYDYLTNDFISKIARIIVGEKNKEYQRKKKEATLNLEQEIISYKESNKELLSNLKKLLSNRWNLRVKKLGLTSKALSIALVPVIAISSAYNLGKKESSKIPLYKTITRTVNSETGEIIGTPIESYDERGTTYVATVMEYGPYRKNPTGVGYIRDVIAYEYIAPANTDENYHATSEELKNNVFEKYTYIEQKDNLDINDSMEESTILITETYQDKNDSIPSNKYTVAFTIGGVFAGVAIDLVLFLIGFYDLDTIKKKMEKISNELKDNTKTKNDIKLELENMKESIPQLLEEYNETVRKYGKLDSEIKEEDIYELKKM